MRWNKSLDAFEKALDAQGGEEPAIDTEALKTADFITLPQDVPGTNCENCRFEKDGMCQHEKLKGQPVNEHNCCAYWDNEKALRDWKTQEKSAFDGKDVAVQKIKPGDIVMRHGEFLTVASVEYVERQRGYKVKFTDGQETGIIAKGNTLYVFPPTR